MFAKLINAFTNPVAPERFTEEVSQHIKGLGENIKVEIVEPLHLEVKLPDREANRLHLGNLYRNYLRDKRAKKAMIAQHVQSLLTIDTENFIPKNIIPTIKDWGYIEGVRATMAEKGGKPDEFFVVEEYNSELAIAYAVDSPSSIRFLNPKDLEEVNLQGETLRSFAVSNLRQILPGIEMHGKPPFFTLKAGGMFESSLLLMDRVWNKAELRIQGEILVGVPSRETLLIADSANEPAVKLLRKAASELARSSAYSLTEKIFVRKNDCFEVF